MQAAGPAQEEISRPVSRSGNFKSVENRVSENKKSKP